MYAGSGGEEQATATAQRSTPSHTLPSFTQFRAQIFHCRNRPLPSPSSSCSFRPVGVRLCLCISAGQPQSSFLIPLIRLFLWILHAFGFWVLTSIRIREAPDPEPASSIPFVVPSHVSRPRSCGLASFRSASARVFSSLQPPLTRRHPGATTVTGVERKQIRVRTQTQRLILSLSYPSSSARDLIVRCERDSRCDHC